MSKSFFFGQTKLRDLIPHFFPRTLFEVTSRVFMFLSLYPYWRDVEYTWILSSTRGEVSDME